MYLKMYEVLSNTVTQMQQRGSNAEIFAFKGFSAIARIVRRILQFYS